MKQTAASTVNETNCLTISYYMKILWITNIPFPETSRILGKKVVVGGGWMRSLAAELSQKPGINLYIATTYEGQSLFRHQENSMYFFLLPQSRKQYKYDRSLEPHWNKLLEEIKPDIIHIHGTELAHGIACINAAPTFRYVISLQGLASVIEEYFYAGIHPFKYLRHITLSDIKSRTTIFDGRRAIKARKSIELKYLNNCRHIIGRTFFDYSHVKSINPDVRYYYCGEALRPHFYECERWTLSGKHNYTIFMSQAYSQWKGLHKLLMALSFIKKEYPGVQLRIAGADITGGSKWVQRINSYGSYIRNLVRKLGVEENVTFLGSLDEEGMTLEYRSAHVFVMTSIIENSPNSLGEAQIIGTPCVASFVGGIPDMVDDGVNGLLYRYEDHIALAYKIIEIFADDDLAVSLSANGQKAAAKRHDRNSIANRTLEIYKQLLSNS